MYSIYDLHTVTGIVIIDKFMYITRTKHENSLGINTYYLVSISIKKGISSHI